MEADVSSGNSPSRHSARRAVNADDLVKDLLARDDANRRAVAFRGLCVNGPLMLEAAVVPVSVFFHDCWFEWPVTLTAASLVELQMRDCVFSSLAADRIDVRGDVDLGGSRGSVISLNGAHIGGGLTLAHATLVGGRYPIDPGRSSLRSPLEATGEQSRHAGLVATLLEVDQGVDCRELRCGGRVSIAGAKIGGQLNLAGAWLSNVPRPESHERSRGPALDAGRIDVKLGMVCEEVVSTGCVWLAGGHIGGQLRFGGAKLTNPGASALVANGLTVEGDLSFSHGGQGITFEACGGLELNAAEVGGQLTLADAHMPRSTEAGEHPPAAVSAFDVRVGSDVFVGPNFEADSGLDLRRCEIGKDLVFEAAVVSPVWGSALDLGGGRVGGLLYLDFAEKPGGAVDLRRTRVGGLRDKSDMWPDELRLDGCVYGSLKTLDKLPSPRVPSRFSRPASPDVALRVKWLRHAEKGDGRGKPEYRPQPYTQLMSMYRAQGRDRDARRVARERERGRFGTLGPTGKAWNLFMRWTVGYGYAPWLAAVWLITLTVAGWWL